MRELRIISRRLVYSAKDSHEAMNRRDGLITIALPDTSSTIRASGRNPSWFSKRADSPLCESVHLALLQSVRSTDSIALNFHSESMKHSTSSEEESFFVVMISKIEGFVFGAVCMPEC